MGKILIIHGSDFSRRRIVKVDITKQVEKTIDNPTSYSSLTESIIKNNVQ